MSKRILPAAVALLCFLGGAAESCLSREEAKTVVDGGLQAAQILCVFGSAIVDTEAVRQFCRIANTPGIATILELMITEREGARIARSAGLVGPQGAALHRNVTGPATAADGGR